jgi:hypothetical protein
MKQRYREMINTRRLYQLETTLYTNQTFRQITQQRTLSTLRRLAKFIWKKERRSINTLPIIQFGKGTPHCGEYYSWCDGDTIELAPKQRDILTLTHELVHAMGYDFHDKYFVERQRKLLMRYSPMNPKLIKQEFVV